METEVEKMKSNSFKDNFEQLETVDRWEICCFLTVLESGILLSKPSILGILLLICFLFQI